MIDIKSQIAPKGLEFKPAEFVISDKHATILTVISYPKYIYPGYLSSLTSMSGIKLVIKHIPLPFSTVQKMLNKEIADLKVRYQEEHDRTIQERIKQDYASLEDVVGQNKEIGAVSGNTEQSNQRKVTLDDDLVKTARSVGINLGD